jgi:hypothetical protein
MQVLFNPDVSPTAISVLQPTFQMKLCLLVQQQKQQQHLVCLTPS